MCHVLLFLIFLLSAAPQKQDANKPSLQQQVTQKQVQPPAVAQETPDLSHPKAVFAAQLNAHNAHQENWSETERVIFDGLLVLANIGLVLVGIRQANILGRHEEWMEKQDGKLAKLAQAASDNAKAASNSADLARKNVESFIAKERARISVEVPDPLQLKDQFFNHVKYKVRIIAPTPALIVSSEVNALVLDSTDTGHSWMHSMYLSSSDTAATAAIEQSALIIAHVDDSFRSEVNEKKKFIHFFGRIRYRDVFQAETDVPHETTFGYLWAVGADIKGGPPVMGEGRWLSEWIENPSGINKET